MPPEVIYIAATLAAVLALLGLGWWAGWSLRGLEVTDRARERDAALARAALLQETLERERRAREVTERRADAREAAGEALADGDAARARRLLLGGGGAAPAATPTP